MSMIWLQILHWHWWIQTNLSILLGKHSIIL
jgi:hypothetical protein